MINLDEVLVLPERYYVLWCHYSEWAESPDPAQSGPAKKWLERIRQEMRR